MNLSGFVTLQDMKKNQRAEFSPKRGRQETFLKAFVEEIGNVSEACERCGIVRQTHYSWMDTDPSYPPRFEKAEREVYGNMQTVAENAARKGIRAGNKILLKFCRKNYGNDLVEAILAGDESAFLPR